MNRSDSKTFEPRTYWETHGVGFKGLGVAFNAWMYRVRRIALDRVVATSVPDVASARVLDIGSGTGFYVKRWRELGARSVVGLDLTDVAVSRLSAAFPDATFRRADVGEPLDLQPEAPFNIVSAFDVLFHIVDDSRYRQAFANVWTQLKPGRLFVFSENFVHADPIVTDHQVSRPIADIERAVHDHGFEIVTRIPMFVLMNAPVDTRSRALKGAWRFLERLVSLGEPMGYLAGLCVYPVERLLVRARTESPSTEIMVCRRLADPPVAENASG